jgi:hypothetical protein
MNPTTNTRPLFALGVVCATPAALEVLHTWNFTFTDLVTRHVTGDWGKISAEDTARNEMALTHGGRLLSVYLLPDQTVIWVITEADRSATTLLLPEEY